ncbi:DEAD/DEAH box helicase family protein [uncultured Arcobacter sp.]|uniref:DEAD/DEAH box helicase family protein n=1 Tax=uncultured Arcobacter sp. TaxID=165434 RepID=UPI00262FBCA0|nr:DEAD/DEAH box helicase family protein [uncultured Arcobacter sp.]
MITIKKLNESFLHIDCNGDAFKTVRNAFSFKSKNYWFHPLYKSKKWDGTISLFKDFRLPIGFKDDVLNLFNSKGYEYECSGNLENYDFGYTRQELIDFVHNDLRPTAFNIDTKQIENLILKEYQVDAIMQFLTDNKGVTISPTSSGKSLILYVICQILLKLDSNIKVLILVPKTSLVEQMYGDFKEYSMNTKKYEIESKMQKIYTGFTKDISSNIVISTWQSLQNNDTKYFDMFDACLVDEVHSVCESGDDGKKIRKMLEQLTNAIFKFGVTGTLYDGDAEKMSIQAQFGNIKQYVSTKDLMEDGTVTKTHITNIVLDYSQEDRKTVARKKHEYLDGNGDKKYKYGMTFKEESDFLTAHEDRFKFIIKLCYKLKGNNLILFKDVKNGYGKKIYEALKKLGKEAYYVDGLTKTKDREEIRKIAERSKDIYIVASYKTFSTGINIKKLHNIVLAESTKSKITILQSIGRILRKHYTKSIARIYDIVDDLRYKRRKNYTLKHFLQRVEYYEREGHDYSVKKIDLK